MSSKESMSKEQALQIDRIGFVIRTIRRDSLRDS